MTASNDHTTSGEMLITNGNRKAKGFCGYDWMIDNIRAHGSCYAKPSL